MGQKSFNLSEPTELTLSLFREKGSVEMSPEEITSLLREKKKLISPDALDFLSKQENAQAVLDKLTVLSNPLIITLVSVQNAIEDLSEPYVQHAPVVVHSSPSFKPAAKEIDAQVELYAESDVTGKSKCTGSVDDFVGYFRDRFSRTQRLLKARNTELELIPLGGLKDRQSSKTCRIIGMVIDKRITKNGHTIIEVEDEESSIACLVSKTASNELRQASASLLQDEVVAFDGKISGSLFIVEAILWPDIPYAEKKTVEDPVSVAFLSDLHVGSKYFMQDKFNQFLSFLQGEGVHAQEKETAGRIKYILLAGDLVDGIGIYPSQEKELLTKDVYKQYEIFAEFMKQIPEYIHVIISPGNHDAVRGAQPQPRILPEFTKELEAYSNIHFVGSPSQFSMHGLRTLIYHGDSAFSFIGSIESLSGAYSTPEKIGIEWLRRRHVSPLYGDNPIVPEKRDYLFIDHVPDILHFGHLHHNGYATHRGTTVVNAGAWQDITDYQLKQGFIPTPAKLPVYDMHAGTMRVIDFA